MELKGYYLTRHYQGEDPFMTVMDMERENAVSLCEKIAPDRGVDEARCQKAYLAARDEVEDWLRAQALRAGVEVRERHPVYFVLTLRPEDGPEHKTCFSIAAETADLSCCSFTFDDSFVNHASFRSKGRDRLGATPHPMHGRVLNAAQAAAALQEHGPLGNYAQGGRYIEVQVWARGLACGTRL